MLPAILFDGGSLTLPKLGQIALPAALVGFQPRDDGTRDDDVAIPLLVGGDDVPRRLLRGAAAKGVLVSLLILSPMLALAPVVC